MSPPTTAFIGLGANLGDTVAALKKALAGISGIAQTTLVRQSSFYRSAPVDADGPDYLNAVAQVSTALSPHQLLAQLQRLEQEAGRGRPYPNAPRSLDLDLLLHGDERIATATLTLPHPRMSERAFVLVPLEEIAPALVTASQLAAVASQRIERIDSP